FCLAQPYLEAREPTSRPCQTPSRSTSTRRLRLWFATAVAFGDIRKKYMPYNDTQSSPLKGRPMQTLHILKSAATLIASSGVGAIVGNAIKASTPGDVTKLQKVTITVGSIALDRKSTRLNSSHVK